MTTPAGSRPDATPGQLTGAEPASGAAPDAAPGVGRAEGEPASAAGGVEAVSGVGGAASAAGGVEGVAATGADEDDAGPGTVRRSGLKNPAAAVRGLGAGMLTFEAIVLLLAIQPIRILGGELSGWGVGSVVALAVLAVLLAGVMKRRWAWTAGTVLQVLLLASVVFHWSLGALGLMFGAAWAYALHVRRTIEAGVPVER